MKKNYKEAEVQELRLAEQCLQSFDKAMLEQREEDCATGEFSSARYELAKEFALADEIVIAAPYWDLSFPSMLKVYFEHICVNGITFAYGEKGEEIPLCRAKRLIYITTAGGYIGEQNFGETYINGLCRLFGIKEMKTYTVEGLDIHGCNVKQVLQQTIDLF